MSKKIKLKVILAIVLSVVLLFLILCFQNIKVKMIEKDIANRYYNDYYLKLVPHKTEEELAAHFDKMGGRISISAKTLSSLDKSFAEDIEKLNYKETELVIKPVRPYLQKKINYKFYEID